MLNRSGLPLAPAIPLPRTCPEAADEKRPGGVHPGSRRRGERPAHRGGLGAAGWGGLTVPAAAPAIDTARAAHRASAC